MLEVKLINQGVARGRQQRRADDPCETRPESHQDLEIRWTSQPAALVEFATSSDASRAVSHPRISAARNPAEDGREVSALLISVCQSFAARSRPCLSVASESHPKMMLLQEIPLLTIC